MKSLNRVIVSALLGSVCALASLAHAGGQVIEQEKTYAISGTSGLELYRSIGQHGPQVGNGVRAIAHTNFKLTWSRNYQPRGDGCTLVSAVPKLIVTYTLPKPSGKLPEAVRRRWDIFIDGIRSHEKVHGDFIKDMVKTIEATTVGLHVAGDPKCRKIREEMQKPLSQASLDQRQKSRDFDRAEMSDGANIRRLVMGLIAD